MYLISIICSNIEQNILLIEELIGWQLCPERHPIPSRLTALIQPNTGMRISKPVLERLDDLLLGHDIPHLWVRKKSRAISYCRNYY